jgi:hypothetical protein
MTEYQAYIKNITTNEWIKTEEDGAVTFTNDENDKLAFYDESDAESTLVYLNDTQADAYVLFLEDDATKMHHEIELEEA